MLQPAPVVVELNTRSDGAQIQTILARLTERTTVPNILLNVCCPTSSSHTYCRLMSIQGKSIGGSDDIQKLHEAHELKAILEEGGLEVTGEV